MASHLRSERIRLTALTENDLAIIARWYEDVDFLRQYDSTPAYPRAESQWKDWLHDIRNEKNAYYFAIRLIQDDTFIGIMDICGVSINNRNGAVGIAIGDADHRGKGYGEEAMILMLRFAFHELNLHRVWLTVFSYNKNAIRLYERIGFTHEGTHREHILRDGNRYDMLLYGILAHEWNAKLTQ